MKALKLTLFTLTCLLFTAGSRPAKAPKDNLVATVSRIQDEVNNLALEKKTLIYKVRKELMEMNTLIDDMDKVIRKIDSHEITYWNNKIENDEIGDVIHRINDFNDKNDECADKNKALCHRTVAVNCELDANPRLKRLVSVDYLQEKIDEWNSLMKEYNPQMDIYNDRMNDFKSRLDKLPR